jgi:hypothetical protein
LAWTFFQDSVIQDQHIQTVRVEPLPVRTRQFTIPYLIRLLDDLKPHALLVPEVEAIGARRRSSSTADSVTAIVAEAHLKGIAVHVLNSQTIKTLLKSKDGLEARNKCDVNERVAEEFPEMTPMLPKARTKAFQPEEYFEPLFNTVAMFLAWREMPSPMERRRQRV